LLNNRSPGSSGSCDISDVVESNLVDLGSQNI